MLPGEYATVITVTPERSRGRRFPFVLPFFRSQLADTDIQYGMMKGQCLLRAGFGRLDGPGTKILAAGALRSTGDMREHGMTMVYPHSRFVYAPC